MLIWYIIVVVAPHVNITSDPRWKEFVTWIRYNMKEIKTNPRWLTKCRKMVTRTISQHSLTGKRKLSVCRYLGTATGIDTTTRPAATPTSPSLVTPHRLEPCLHASSMPSASPLLIHEVTSRVSSNWARAGQRGQRWEVGQKRVHPQRSLHVNCSRLHTGFLKVLFSTEGNWWTACCAHLGRHGKGPKPEFRPRWSVRSPR